MCKVLKSISRMLIEGFGQATPLDLIISRMTEACNMKSWIESYTQGCGFEGFASNSSWSLVSGRRSWCDCHMESLFESYTQRCHRFEGCASKILWNLVCQRRWQLQHGEFNFKSKHKDLLILLLQVLKIENMKIEIRKFGLELRFWRRVHQRACNRYMATSIQTLLCFSFYRCAVIHEWVVFSFEGTWQES
jgi:hypothetical protein